MLRPQVSEPKSDRVEFTARMICPLGDPVKNKTDTFDAGDASIGSAAVTLMLAQNQITWEDLEFCGQIVAGSVMSGIGSFHQNGDWSATGYDFGELANGDHYLSRWEESGDSSGVSGSWELIVGTGVIQGIKGKATFKEPASKQGDTSVTAVLTGWYTLPK